MKGGKDKVAGFYQYIGSEYYRIFRKRSIALRDTQYSVTYSNIQGECFSLFYLPLLVGGTLFRKTDSRQLVRVEVLRLSLRSFYFRFTV